MKKLKLLFALLLFSMIGFSQEEEINEIPFAVIERVPVHPNCDEKLDNRSLKTCMGTEIQKLVGKHFNTSIANHLYLPAGKKRIHVLFKIDTVGNVGDIKIRAPHKVLKDEALRVVNLIPEFKKPGFQKGRPVKVAFALPIIFTVEETVLNAKPLSKKEKRRAKRLARRKAKENN